MEKFTTKRMSLFTGRTHPALAQEVAEHLGIALTDPNLVQFANGEIRPRFTESIRGSDVFIMQTHCGNDEHSINDSIMEQLIMIDTAYRASARSHNSGPRTMRCASGSGQTSWPSSG